VLGLAAIVAWRLGRIGGWAPVAVTALELGALFFAGPASWSWAVRLPESSPVLQRMAEMRDVGLVASRLQNVPVDAGLTVAYPSLGIIPPPPNYLLESAMRPPGENNEIDRRWQRRFGVTHGIWSADDDIRGFTLLAVVPDPALDQVMARVPKLRGRGPWKLVRDPAAFPPAWVARRVREADNWGRLYSALSMADLPDEAWFLTEDRPPELPGPAAGTANVRSWDGRAAVVEHDGSCVLILRRTFYPGWFYRIDDGPELPVLKVNGGLQGVPLTGAGTSHVEASYHPTGLARAAAISLAAIAAALGTLGTAGLMTLRQRRDEKQRAGTTKNTKDTKTDR
jgi:hypothetical protein